jgi:predicted Zn finger-like uncharacterized protein
VANYALFMLIICPNCATSYSIDQGSLGPSGRTVRCARCKTSWFADAKPAQQADVSAFVDRVIAEAEAQPNSPSNEIPAKAVRPEAPSPVVAKSTPPPEPPTPQAAQDILPPAESSPPIDGNLDIRPGEETVPVTESPSLVPLIEQEPLPEPATETAETDQDDIETFAARRERLQSSRKLKQNRSRWTAIILVLVAINVAVIGARDEVVRFLPQTASLFSMIGLPVNLRHLAFEDVKVSRETTEGVAVLLIEGNIVSKSAGATEVPRLRFAARNAKGQELYTWTALPSRSILGPGEILRFHSRLASPPKDASDVMVRFFNSHDKIGAVK